MLSARELVVALGGRWHGTYGTCCCPAHDDRTPSLSIRDGDNVEPFVRCFAGCDWRDVKKTLHERGLLPVGNRWRGGDRHRHQHLGRHRGRASDPNADDRRRIFAARSIWNATEPIAGSIGELYFHRRGITISIPPTIRFAPALKYPGTQLRLPAVVMAVQNRGGAVVGVQRVFLTANGAAKAHKSPPKLAKGIIAGGAVRLGPSGRELGMAEGDENGCAVMQMRPELSVWCALWVSNLPNVWLPPMVELLHLFLDGDKPDSPAAAAAAKQQLNSAPKSRYY